MSNIVAKILYPFVKRYALSFLHEERVDEKQEKLLKEKFRRAYRTKIGKEIGVNPKSSINELPMTTYNLYRKYFENPQEGDFLYPLNEYIRAITSGTMGRPKTFLLPKSAIWDNIKKTGLSNILLHSHDGEKITFEIGDTYYRNTPGGSYLSGFLTDTLDRQGSGWVKQVPDLNLSFQEKVEYFIENFKDIDIAYMTVTTLLDEVYPRIGKPFYLKGFITADRSAGVLKEKIKEITGGYPKVTYGSTETMLSALSSIEYPGSFFFDWRIMYCEFIPEDQVMSPDQEKVEDLPETVPLNEVKVGEKYQLIATPFKNDMTRYVMPDVFECVSKGDDILGTELPAFNFFARIDKLIVLHNFTRIAEDELLHVLKKAEIPFVDFTTRMEIKGARDHMVMYLELYSAMKAEDVTRLIHQELIKFDKDYRDLTEFLKYIPLEVHLLPRGAFRRYLRLKEGQPRIERIGMKEDRFKELLGIS
jgi:hypothetical protein